MLNAPLLKRPLLCSCSLLVSVALPIAVALSAVSLGGALTTAALAKPLDLKKEREAARALYSKKRFDKAQQVMTNVVQRHPLSTEDYLMLARTAYANKKYTQASVAYQIYFKRTRRADSRAKDEYATVKKNINAKRDERYLEGTLERVKHLDGLIQAGKLSGKQGALKALERIKVEGLFHPQLHQSYGRLQEELFKANVTLLDRWWARETGLLKEAISLSKLWGSWSKSIAGDEELAERQTTLLSALINLQSKPEQALKLLKDSPNAISATPVARYLLLYALVLSGEAEEALSLSRSLSLRANSADLKRLKMIEAHLLAERLAKGAPSPSDESLLSFVEQLSAH